MNGENVPMPISADQSEHEECTVVKIGHTCDVELPKQITKEIDNLLHVAGHYFQDGYAEMPMLFFVLDKDGNGYLVDPSNIPIKPLVSLLVKRVLDQMDAVAIIRISEGHTLPDHISKQWIENGRPKGAVVSEHPEAQEVLMMQVETLQGTWVASTNISAFVEGETRIVDSELNFKKAEKMGGGFSNLLKQNRPDGEQENPMLAILATLIDGSFVKEGDEDDAQEPAKSPLVQPGNETKH